MSLRLNSTCDSEFITEIYKMQQQIFYLTYLFTFTCKCFVTFSLYGTKIGKDLSDEDMILQIENGKRQWIFAHEIEKIEEIVKESNPGD